ncbi:MAG: DUF2157 domain-containing protein [Acidobacteriota bacterium]
MTTLERLDAWRAAGLIAGSQHDTLAALVRRERVSVYAELSALLYLGVLSFAGGLAWTFRANVAHLGDTAILSALLLIAAGAISYCFAHGQPFAPVKVEAPNLAFDYVLYLGCLVLALAAGHLEYRFSVVRAWHHHLLLLSGLFGGLAYRFDNRFVLSLALSSLAGWAGLGLATWNVASTDALRVTALLYAVLTAGLGFRLYRRAIKPHFLDLYLHLAANVALAAVASGIVDAGTGLVYLLLLLLLCAAAIVLGARYRRFAFVAYGTLYGYGAISVRLLDVIGGPTAFLLYLLTTGTVVLIALVAMARRIGREE